MLRGPEIRRAFLHHRFANGSHYAWTYRADGSIDGISLGKPLRGRWRIVGNLLCQTLDSPEACSTVERDGSQVRLRREGLAVEVRGALEIDRR